RGPRPPQAEGALGRAGAARGHRARHRLRPDGPGLRRAHWRPRPRHRGRDPAPPAGVEQGARQDGRDGHARSASGGVRASSSAFGQGDDDPLAAPPPSRGGGGGDGMRYLPLLWAGFFRKKPRTILTLLSIVVAFALFGLLQAVKVAFDAGADMADAKRLVTIA